MSLLSWAKPRPNQLWLIALPTLVIVPIFIVALFIPPSAFRLSGQAPNGSVQRLPVASSLMTVGSSPIIGTITHEGFEPSALALDVSENRLFVFDKSNGYVYYYNATTLEEQGSVATGFTQCISMVVDESLGKLYVGSFAPGAGDGDRIAVIDTATGAFLKYIKSSGYTQLINDEPMDLIYESSNGQVARINAATDVKTAIANVRGNLYTGMAVNPTTHELFVSNWSQNDGNFFVVNPTTLAVTTVENMPGMAVAINWTENKAYVSYCNRAGLESICIYDHDDGSIASLHVENDATQPLVFNPTVNRLYSDTEVNRITTIFNGSTNEYTNVELTGGLTDIAVRHSNDNVYFANQNGTYVMDGATHEITAEFPAEGVACSLCTSAVLIDQASGRVYVINEAADGNVTVIQDAEFTLPNCTVTPIATDSSTPGTISTSDCRSPLRHGTSYWDPYRADRYSITVDAGQDIRIVLDSSVFYEYLYLINPSGDVIAEAQGDFFTTAEIPSTGWYNLTETGTYTIEVTSVVSNIANGLAYTLTISTPDPSPTPTPVGCTNIVQDPSFELDAPNPYWDEASTNFGTPLCTVSGCGGVGASSGNVWGWFGGTASNEIGYLGQSLTIPEGTARLKFYLWISSAGAGSGVDDTFTASIDSTPFFTTNATQIETYPSYTLVDMDASDFADGGTHTLKFESNTSGQTVNFNLDDVALCSEGAEPVEFTVLLPLVIK
jgi:DNA-binding beta-propeller fold protein YncE